MTIEITWSGKTRDAIESNLLALLEMNDISRSTYEAFNKNSQEVIFECPENAKQALEEMEYISDMGNPEIHEPTLRDKISELSKETSSISTEEDHNV